MMSLTSDQRRPRPFGGYSSIGSARLPPVTHPTDHWAKPKRPWTPSMLGLRPTSFTSSTATSQCEELPFGRGPRGGAPSRSPPSRSPSLRKRLHFSKGGDG